MPNDAMPDELKKAIEEHKEKIDSIVKSHSDKLAADPPPKLIYHYTDDQGLKGILETGRLWFTDLFYLNDPSELEHGIKHGLDALQSAANTGPNELKFFHKIFADTMNNRVKDSANYFVCCFSKTDHDLGQWRAYADDGQGYAIGFDAGLLENAFGEAESINVATFPITYDDELLYERQEQLVAETVPLVSTPRDMNLAGEIVKNYFVMLSVRLATALIETSIYFKHEAYKTEDEYRFLKVIGAHRDAHVKFRSRPHTLVRYREFDWKTAAADSIREIVIGPSGDFKVRFTYVSDCLQAYWPKEGVISIRKSDIPYRSVRSRPTT